ncbi:MAG: zf-TFIIB domain-containing protein [Gemmatimonadaceae bacterium]
MPIDEKPSRNEDEYWAKVDAELIKSRRAALDAERENARMSEQQNKCPRCCVDLKEREYHHVKIDECAQCGGVWLDKGELEMLQQVPRDKSGGFLGSMFGIK